MDIATLSLVLFAAFYTLTREFFCFLASKKYKNLKIKHEKCIDSIINMKYENEYLKKRIEDLSNFLTESKIEMEKSANLICQNAISNSQRTFMSVAESLIEKTHEKTSLYLSAHKNEIKTISDPLTASLKLLEEHIRQLESTRAGAYEGLIQQLRELSEGQKFLKSETNNLVSALRSPHIRGCWGEMQLRRVVELAGMLPHCDFDEQVTLKSENSSARPDLIIRLPGGRFIVVDAKTPVSHYLDSLSSKNETEQKNKLKDHARTLTMHAKLLGEKEYWKYKDGPEFVLLFIPGEAFLSSALSVDPSIIETAAKNNVILATPTILIALLKTISYGWKQEKLRSHVHAISEIGKDMHSTIEKMRTAIVALGKGMGQSTKAYNQTIEILNTDVRALSQRLEDIGACEENSATNEKRMPIIKGPIKEMA
ncbi:DNA recombination protein RmuC [Candidatus Hydrogenosomobacter endosymbioticus]|uniref:DNA recombination protein RmuC homolog n=1 Tax=Candidatus Hydrogenosomobacter endosymbioticus TaxID=2558174 RepID=A0ABN6L8F7_9PROT|nr:DNA recombination protein RmuC [Candidatus Hydrogenosomobacter endosymbioticus]BDB96437.1 DNA recombination protein RmuC [Candidatus Hydrogenosomobacter endosymbioticus]